MRGGFLVRIQRNESTAMTTPSSPTTTSSSTENLDKLPAASSSDDLQRVRDMADRLDCLIEEDFQLLSNTTSGTVEAWRKRGKGPAYILLGNRYLYPRKAVASYLQSITKERSNAAKGAFL